MSFIPFLGPLALIAAALALRWAPITRGGGWLRAPEIAALIACAGALLAAISLALGGPVTSPLLGNHGLGLSARTDVVAVALALTVSFVGWVVLRFSRTALDGEPAHAAFLSRMSWTLAAVLMLVVSG
ncbi:MAG: oxidoreductase, partial [Pseudomonadota bacterium]